MQLLAQRADRADAQDVLHAVEVVKLVAVNADGGHTHAAGHYAHRHAFVGPGVALDAADVVDEAAAVKEVFGDELRAQRVAGHEYGFGEIAGSGAVMRCGHDDLLLFIL